MLGVTPLLGRAPGRAVGEDGVPEVAIGEIFWREELGAPANIIGSALVLNGKPSVVVGVMPDGFTFYFNSHLWLVLDRDSLLQNPEARFTTIGLLEDGVSIEDARSQVSALEGDLPVYRPWEATAPLFVMDEIIARNALPRPLMRLLLGVVFLVLTVACANIANLLLVRTIRQRTELAVRAALGGGPAALMRPGLFYGGVIILFGGALGLALAVWFNKAIADRFSATLPESVLFQLDARFIIAAIVAVTLVVIATTLPALRLSMRSDVMPVISSGNQTPTRQVGRFNQVALAVQIAVMCAVTTAAVQIWGTYRELISLNPGFPAEELLAVDLISDDPEREPTAAAWSIAMDEILVQLAERPEVAGVTHRWSIERTWEQSSERRRAPNDGVILTDEAVPPVNSPGSLVFMSDTLFTDTTPFQPVPFQIAGPTRAWAVGPGFFDATGIELLSGRSFEKGDGSGDDRVAILSNALALALWPDESAVGRRLRLGPEGPWLTVVGTTRDVRTVRASAWEGTLVGPEYTMYMPHAQAESFRPTLLIRQGANGPHTGNPLSLAPLVEQAVNENRLGLSPVRIRPYVDDLAVIANERKVFARLLGGCAAAVLCLGALGLFAMLSFYANSRLAEFGIRSALGASTRELARELTLPLKSVVVRGAAGGLLLTLVLSKTLAAQVSSRGGSLLLALLLTSVILALTLLASSLPVILRVARRGPMVVIRESSGK